MAFEGRFEQLKDGANDAWNSLNEEARTLAFAPDSSSQVRNIPLNAAEIGMGGVFVAGGLMARGKLGLAAGIVGLGCLALGANGIFNFEKSTFDKIGSFLNV